MLALDSGISVSSPPSLPPSPPCPSSTYGEGHGSNKVKRWGERTCATAHKHWQHGPREHVGQWHELCGLEPWEEVQAGGPATGERAVSGRNLWCRRGRGLGGGLLTVPCILQYCIWIHRCEAIYPFSIFEIYTLQYYWLLFEGCHSMSRRHVFLFIHFIPIQANNYFQYSITESIGSTMVGAFMVKHVIVQESCSEFEI